MALTGFVIIMTETLPAGLLPEVSSGLAVSEGAAGQLVSAYALGTVLAAIPAIAATRSLSRKPLLVLGIAGFVVANAVTALSGAYSLTLVARFVAGAFSGLLWGMIPGYTRRIVAAERAGTGLAVAMVGTPVALSIGTPLGTFAGALIGWRWTFAAMSVLAVALVVWVLIGVPNAPGQPSENRTSLLRVLLIPGVAPVLAVVLGWMLAHNILYTYIAPFLAFTGVGGRVDVVLLIFGLCALAGIWFTGTLVDRALRRLVLVSLAGFGLVALGLGVAGGVPVVFYLAVLVWGLTFGGASTQLNTAVADAAGDETDIAAAMVTTAWNLAIFGGSALGAVLLETDDPGSFPWALLVLIAASLLVALFARRHAFTPGPRSGDSAT
ncbi:MFS transporter [Saccharopolyspora gloriosae]|uniref:Putative MFS family arabinose efflux permease n=1 Tax=Saccharopolyspora gloriosae TaxID=455344 RepID=A0A840NRR3_9PSEU|nr:MFS transporter [Saccharopolyspora gloriosae]MBB5071959.1 putative MFS family arabinose efflux permease [Saccharopolyspora gloriosae]